MSTSIYSTRSVGIGVGRIHGIGKMFGVSTQLRHERCSAFFSCLDKFCSPSFTGASFLHVSSSGLHFRLGTSSVLAPVNIEQNKLINHPFRNIPTFSRKNLQLQFPLARKLQGSTIFNRPALIAIRKTVTRRTPSRTPSRNTLRDHTTMVSVLVQDQQFKTNIEHGCFIL